eukprot:500357-Prorocentrum_minimum.AAC.2
MSYPTHSPQGAMPRQVLGSGEVETSESGRGQTGLARSHPHRLRFLCSGQPNRANLNRAGAKRKLQAGRRGRVP